MQAGLRPDGVFLGERDHNGDPLPEFIWCPAWRSGRSHNGLLDINDRMHEGSVDAVLKATATAFGFVHVHPFHCHGRNCRYASDAPYHGARRCPHKDTPGAQC